MQPGFINAKSNHKELWLSTTQIRIAFAIGQLKYCRYGVIQGYSISIYYNFLLTINNCVRNKTSVIICGF